MCDPKVQMRYRCNDAAASGAAASLSRGRSVSEFMPDPKPARVRIVVCAVSKHRTAAQEPRARRPDPHPIRSAPEGSRPRHVCLFACLEFRVPNSAGCRTGSNSLTLYICIPCSTTVRSTLHRLSYDIPDRFDRPVRFRLHARPAVPRIERIVSAAVRVRSASRRSCPRARAAARPARRARARGHLQSRGGSLVRAGARETSGRP